MPPQKDVPMEEAKEIIQYQTQMINEKTDIIKEIFSSLDKTP